MIVLGDLNVNYEFPKDLNQDEILTSFKSYDFINLYKRFKLPKNKLKFWTWRKFINNKKIQSICDYVLYGSQVKFDRLNMIDTNFDSDHRLILGRIKIEKSKVYKSYIKSREKFPINIHNDSGDVEANCLLQELQEENYKVQEELTNITVIKEKRKDSWISEETIKVMRQKAKSL